MINNSLDSLFVINFRFRNNNKRILSPLPPRKVQDEKDVNAICYIIEEFEEQTQLTLHEKLPFITSYNFNQLMKAFFPCLFICFVFLFTLAIYFKWGDIEELNKL